MANKGKTISTKGKLKTRVPNVGEEFGYWKVLDNSLVEVKPRHWGIVCRCKCGTQRLVRINALIKGLSKGCECRAIEVNKGRVNSVGDFSETLYGRFRKGAKVRSLVFDLTKEYLWELFLRQNKKCALSGLFLNMEKSVSRKKGQSNIDASLDRIDSSKGYIEGNVQWVHKDVNKMKQDLNEDRFKQLCKLITKKYD